MKKFIIWAFLLCLGVGTAAARVVSITDWHDPMPGRVNGPEDKTISCEEQCPGYSLSTTYCYVTGEVLEDCPAEGCSYYHRCVPAE